MAALRGWTPNVSETWATALRSDSFLEYAFLRWILTPLGTPGLAAHVVPQSEISVGSRSYRIDYEVVGASHRFAIELDGFEFHGQRSAFTYDRLRQNDIHATGRTVVRFSYDAIRTETRRCVEQLQALLRLDPLLAPFVVATPVVEAPEMNSDPLFGLGPGPVQRLQMSTNYFDQARQRLDRRPLRRCQADAFAALGNYFATGGTRAACIMSVGAGKTALGVAACLAFTRRRALVVTPGSVILGTFGAALDPNEARNVLYALPGGPLLPGCPPPKVLVLDREREDFKLVAIREVTREQLLAADIIVTNFHSLGTGADPDDLLAKLQPSDIDFVVVDEAHIAAADSYQRAFAHFVEARTLLMSACFQRLDGKPIEADVVYKYRLIDSIADGNAKNLRLQRFVPDIESTTYEMVWPDGRREEIRGREQIMALLDDERKLARVTARSHEPIRQVMRAVKQALDGQATLLAPIKPRVLFSALGEKHAEQIALIANEHGIPCGHVHYAMTASRVKTTKDRFENAAGDLQGLVQLKMLGQGYDFPAITVVVPMRPYGSFSEFYQFLGRGIRVLHHPALTGRVAPRDQHLDIVFHAELGLEAHIEVLYRENDMEPPPLVGQPPTVSSTPDDDPKGSRGPATAERPEFFVVFERGELEQRIVHDETRVEERRAEREREAMAQRYAAYAQKSSKPVSFDQYVELFEALRE
ncbi:MAG: DEAD/DEAH box helicase family protein [Polyangiaceae bacterium]